MNKAKHLLKAMLKIKLATTQQKLEDDEQEKEKKEIELPPSDIADDL